MTQTQKTLLSHGLSLAWNELFQRISFRIHRKGQFYYQPGRSLYTTCPLSKSVAYPASPSSQSTARRIFGHEGNLGGCGCLAGLPCCGDILRAAAPASPAHGRRPPVTRSRAWVPHPVPPCPRRCLDRTPSVGGAAAALPTVLPVRGAPGPRPLAEKRGAGPCGTAGAPGAEGGGGGGGG